MSYIYKLVFCLLFYFSANGQTIQLMPTHLDAKDKGLVMYSNRAKHSPDSTLLPLKMQKFQCFENKLIYQSKNEGHQEKFLSVAYTSDKKGNVLMVFDLNQNRNFLDDSIYTIPNTFYSNISTNIYTSSPLIEIESLQYFDGVLEKK